MRTLRTRIRAGALVALALVVGALALGGWVYYEARSNTCDELPREDLSLGEMAALNRRLDHYKQDQGSPLQLSAREASFLVREQFDLPAWLAIRGTDLTVQARIAREGRCWNVAFRGSLEVRGGEPFIATDDLTVGRLNLGWFVRGWRFGLPRSWLATGDAQVDELMEHLVSVEVADGQLAVQLDDPKAIK